MSDPIEQASNLNDIQFPEFTSKLITDTFDALINANLRQIQSYSDLVEATAKTLTTYINDTVDDIDGEEILDFLITHFPALNSEPDHDSSIRQDVKLTTETAAKLNESLKLSDGTSLTQPEFKNNDVLKDEKWDSLMTAIAQRLAQNKYTLLQAMVKQGMLRLVVDRGVIETKLHFRSYQNNRQRSSTSDYQRSKSRSRSRGGFSLGFVGLSAGSSRNSLRVSTANTSSSSYNSSSVSIFGGVKIEFSTDYESLS